MELHQGTGMWGLGKGSAPEGGGHSPELLELREHWDTTPSHRGWVLGIQPHN